MPRELRIAYFAHSLRSDWNNGNAHFLRGLLHHLDKAGQDVTVFEQDSNWSIENLREEPLGQQSLQQFEETYPDLNVRLYRADQAFDLETWHRALAEMDLVVLHEWNPPELADLLLKLRDEIGYQLLFHDTHHRASSSPQQIKLFGIDRFDGVIAFGEALADVYRTRFGLQRVWTLHEAADVEIFRPLPASTKQQDVVWVGNWGDDERTDEIRRFLLDPAAALPQSAFRIHGVRYPEAGLAALQVAGVSYGGYLPNLDAPEIFAESRLTVHVPRQQYSGAMTGIPTIRVFEALACGIPLISAPWKDTENLFHEGDFLWADNTADMIRAMEHLLTHQDEAQEQADRGLETVLERHTCAHRAQQFLQIAEELFR
ncbi:MAG: CgeB family protein [Janthinobacterium lividum]